MKEAIFRKGMVLAIIGCFIGAGVFPSISGNIEQISENSISSVEEVLSRKIDYENNGNDPVPLDITSNLKGYWNFEDSITDGKVTDNSGCGKDGTIYGNPQQELGNHGYGNYLEFDGANDFIEFGDDSHFDITGDITIALWFKTDTIQRSGLVTKLDGGDPDNGYCLMMSTYAWDPAGTISFKLAYQSSGGMHSYDVFTTSSTFTDNQWHHLAAVYTPDGVSRPKIYIDGSEQPGSPYGHALSAIGASPGWNFRIAAGYGGGDRFNGAIDEVRIYDRALSPDDINELCNGGGPTQPWYFIYLADTHVVNNKDINEDNKYWTIRWEKVINDIRMRPDPPKFVVCSGDLVDWGANWPWDHSGSENWDAFLKVNGLEYSYVTCRWYIGTNPQNRIPIFFCPGNHDARQYGVWGLIGQNFNGYHINTHMDTWFYSEIVENCAIFSLNSGYDAVYDLNIDPPEGSGIALSALNSLETQLDLLDGVINDEDTSGYKKIIIMHHPTENHVQGYSINDGVFWDYNQDFKNICEDYQVDLVLCGHLHSGSEWTIGSTTSCYTIAANRDVGAIRPFNVHTFPTCGSFAGKTEIIAGEEEYSFSTINFDVRGRCKVSIYDDNGNYTGLNESGRIQYNIPHTYYSSWTFINETLGINTTKTELFIDRGDNFNRDDHSNYTIVIDDPVDDTINFTIEVHLKSGINSIATYEDVTLFDGSVATLCADNSIVNYVLIINDPDGTTRFVTPTNYEGNLPPETPNRPDGPSSGKKHREYSFETATIDPDYDNQLCYMWDWGDGTTSEWSGLYNSGQKAKATHTWNTIGNYDIKVKAKDIHGAESEWSPSFNIVISAYDPPLVQLIYPTGGEILKDTVTIEWYAHDSKDGDNLPIYLYYFDEDDNWYQINDILENTGEYQWDTTKLPDGTYTLLVQAVDSNGNIGHDQSEPFEIGNYYEPDNHPPNKPTKPSGPSSGEAGTEYTYTSSTTDPDDDQIWYMWNWGDETGGWLGPYTSGAVCEASHTWEAQGDYTVKVKAKDQHGLESPWSDPLSISMPKSKAINRPFLQFLQNLMQRFPLFARLLQLPIFNKLLNLR